MRRNWFWNEKDSKQNYETSFTNLGNIFPGHTVHGRLLETIGRFIPHLLLDDIQVIKAGDDQLQIKIDYKLSRFFDPSFQL